MNTKLNKHWIKISTSIILLACSPALIAEDRLTFSDYKSQLRIKNINYKNNSIEFTGEIELTGTLVFRLDKTSNTEFGSPLFIDFIPNKNELPLLPQVTKGFYAAGLKSISLLNAQDLYEQLFGKGYKSPTREQRISGIITLKSYSSSVECDSRHYSATIVNFEKQTSTSMVNKEPISGC